jgi:hypothetical protein
MKVYAVLDRYLDGSSNSELVAIYENKEAADARAAEENYNWGAPDFLCIVKEYELLLTHLFIKKE